jgi:hypothetical protein
MADTKTPGADLRQTYELDRVNPLICSNGDTMPVQSVLSLLSFLLTETTDGRISLSTGDSLGLAFILDTCKAALENMPRSEARHD